MNGDGGFLGLSKRHNWRLWVATQMFRAASALEFFTIGIVRPEDLVASARRFYTDPTHVTLLVEKSADGLYPSEVALLERIPSKAGTALVLGCGAGREAIALAKEGWQVMGIDNAPVLLDAARANAAQAGVHIDFQCHDISQGIFLDRSFDLICLFGLPYSLIPTRKWRVQLLTACRQHLQPDGRCLLDFSPDDRPSRREARAQRWRKGLAWFVGGNRECQLGDYWFKGNLFYHRFSTGAEIAEEVAAAGLSLVEYESDEIPKGMAIFKRSTA